LHRFGEGFSLQFVANPEVGTVALGAALALRPKGVNSSVTSIAEGGAGTPALEL
jgi:hypothetical protein